MAAKSRRESPALKTLELDDLLRDDPNSVGFFQAVRILERLYPDRERVGGYGDPADEVAHFGANHTISFPASEIQAINLSHNSPSDITVNFMGLIGPLGLLPYYYSLLASERVRGRDRAMKDFLDIFHHRMISLFYQAWEKHQFAIAYERDQQDRLTVHLMDLLGLANTGSKELGVELESFLFYSGLLAPHQRSALALQQMIEDYFGVPVEIEQFVGGWYPIAEPTQCRLGDEDSASSQLGWGAVAGDEVWDQQARVRVKLGPLDREQYDRFLPDGQAYSELQSLTRFFSDDQFDFEVQLVLARDEVPGCVLGTEDVPGPLGWCTWMRSAPFSRDADETILTL
jgi:type VI secretion system protein ImpH